MPWSQAQKERLTAEKSILDYYFPGCVKWMEPMGDTKADISLKTNNNNKYTLRIFIDEDFPNSVPSMVVLSSPKPMPDWETSSATHTLRKRDGYLRICHTNSDQWSDRSSLYQVVMKGRVWLEAYECHLRTEKPMNFFLRDVEQNTRSGNSSDVEQNVRIENSSDESNVEPENANKSRVEHPVENRKCVIS